MPFSATLDANVLYPNSLRDTLLRVAELGLYQPLWSERILGEVRGCLLRHGRTEETADRAIGFIREAFPEAMVSGWEHLENSMRNHSKDRHVLAAAVCGHADVIVTANLKDFPQTALEIFHLEAQHPDTFLCGVLEDAPDLVVRVIKDQAAFTGRGDRKKLTTDDVLSALETLGVHVFAHQVRLLLEQSAW